AAGAHAAACPAAPAVVQVARRLVPPRAFLTVLVRFPRRSTPFPYTTLFRSRRRCRGGRQLGRRRQHAHGRVGPGRGRTRRHGRRDRKSTRLNSSHVKISYAVFCLKKKTTHGKLTVARRTHKRRRRQTDPARR